MNGLNEDYGCAFCKHGHKAAHNFPCDCCFWLGGEVNMWEAAAEPVENSVAEKTRLQRFWTIVTDWGKKVKDELT